MFPPSTKKEIVIYAKQNRVHVKFYNYVYMLLLCCFLLQEYIHRVGRTARGEGGRGHALLILRPEELGFLRYLKQAKVPLNEFEFSWNKISNIQPQVGPSQISSTAPPPPPTPGRSISDIPHPQGVYCRHVPPH